MGIVNYLFKKIGFVKVFHVQGKKIEVNRLAMVYSQRGIKAFQEMNYQGAVEQFSKAIMIQPRNQNFYTFRGTAYANLGKNDEALKDYTRALALDPINVLAAYRLGMVYYHNGEPAQAIKWLRVSFENSGESDLSSLGLNDNNLFFVHKKIIAAQLGNLLMQSDQLDEGIIYLDEALRLESE